MTEITRRAFLDRTKNTSLVLAAGFAALGSMADAEEKSSAENKSEGAKVFRAGAYAMDITPTWFPVLVNGYFNTRTADAANDPLHARCLVLDDGTRQIALAIIDSCVIPETLVEEIKKSASAKTGIPVGHIMVSATHTHSAPSACGALGTPPDEKYVKFLPDRVAEGIAAAQKNLVPAKVGWAIGELPELAQSRRWIARPDKLIVDPFGEKTTRATMHPGYRNPDFEEPSGPMDPAVSVLAVQSTDGKPLALLAAYSIHYVDSPLLSADYFGVFADKIAEMVGPGDPERPFVGMLANGTSGDAYINDYTLEKAVEFDRFIVADAVAKVAFAAYKSMEMHDWAPLAVAEETLELATRKPKLAWAKPILDKLGDKPPQTNSEVYAREQIILSEMPPTRRLRLQALRIGGLGIAAIPAEVFAITGLKIRRRSPLQPTFSISLANGWDGYLPPPEQLAMGGYETYLARSSCLENNAEPKIVDAVMRLLDKVAGDERAGDGRVAPPPREVSAYEKAVLNSKPSVFLPLDEMNGPNALDAVSGKKLGRYETQIAYFMPGPRPPEFPGMTADSRAAHFVGERLIVDAGELGGDFSASDSFPTKYTVEFWFYNAMPSDAREVTGHLFSLGPSGIKSSDDGKNPPGDHLAIGGKGQAAGKLVFCGGGQKTPLCGNYVVPMRAWTHAALVRDGEEVAVYLNGNPQADLSGKIAAQQPADNVCPRAMFIGGRNDGICNFEGKICNLSVYNRPLPPDEIVVHHRSAIDKP